MKAVLVEGNNIELHNSFEYKEYIKTMQGRKWEGKRKIWIIPASYDNIAALKRVMHKLSDDIMKIYEEQKKKIEKTAELKNAEVVEPVEPMPVKIKPFMHQIKGYNLAMMHGNAGLLMEMGTGKSFTTVAVVGRRYLKKEIQKVLIVAPSSVVPVWPKEFKEYANFAYEVKVLAGSSTERVRELKTFRKQGIMVAVINYESTWRIVDELLAWGPDMIICDESQKIKGATAKQSKALHKLGDHAKYKMILTGTPVTQAPLDFWSQYRFLDKSIFGTSYFAFRARYAIMGGFQKHQVFGYNNLEELTRKAHSIAFRVTKAEALDLPEQIDETRYCELEPAALKVYKELKAANLAELGRGDSITTQNVLTRLLRLSQITGGFVNTDEGTVEAISQAKLNALEDIVEDMIDAGKKLVVFARFTAEINAIRKMLEKKKIMHSYIDGSVTDRGEAVRSFQQNEDCMVFIGQVDTANAGITLTASDTVAFYSVGYNYASYEQARARIHRIGQKNNCTYIHLVCTGTVDEKVIDALKTKRDIAKVVVDDWREILGTN